MRTTRKTVAALALAAPLAVGAVAAPSLAFADTAAPAAASASGSSTEADTDSVESLEKQLEAIYDRHSDLWDKVFEEAFADLDEADLGADEGEPDEQDPATGEGDEDFFIHGAPEDGDEEDLVVLEGPDADEKELVNASTRLTQEEKATLHQDIDEADVIWERLVELDQQQDGDVEKAEDPEEADEASALQEADNA